MKPGSKRQAELWQAAEEYRKRESRASAAQKLSRTWRHGRLRPGQGADQDPRQPSTAARSLRSESGDGGQEGIYRRVCVSRIFKVAGYPRLERKKGGDESSSPFSAIRDLSRSESSGDVAGRENRAAG